MIPKPFNLVNTIEIKPCVLLQPYVRGFTYREINSFDFKICRPMVATHEFMITFNLADKKYGYLAPPGDAGGEDEKTLRSEIVITGVGSQLTGMMTSSGEARVFSIYFKPAGFYRIFNIPAVHFTNVIEEDERNCNKTLPILHDQLRAATTVAEMIAHSEDYLLKILMNSKAKDPYNAILSLAELLTHNPRYSVEKSAYDANMSIKTFERKFTGQVGVSPKLFARIVRFNGAVALKMSDHRRSWTSIAYDCGYFDQMHLIKDFKLFSGTTPSNFFMNTPPVAENLTSSLFERTD